MLPPKRFLGNTVVGLLLGGVLSLGLLHPPWHLSVFLSFCSVAFFLGTLYLYRPLLVCIRKIPSAQRPYWSGLVAVSSCLLLAACSIGVVKLFPILQHFRSIYDAPPAAIIALTALPGFGLGLWVISLRFLEVSQHQSFIKCSIGALLPMIIASFWLPVSFVLVSSMVWLFAFRVYLYNDRSGLLWFLFWLLLITANSAYVMAEVFGWPSNARAILFSTLFLAAFLLSLGLRAVMGVVGVSLRRYRIPLGGEESLRLRVQLSILGLTVIAFFLIAAFSLYFSKSHLPPNISEVWIEQLLTAYVLLLMVASTLGILIADSISSPLIQISNRLEQTGLYKNEPIPWNRQDEIGLIVKKYNQMISDLERSAQQLAEQERESAWREMAQQVAHEIKNPLTPMRLHLQQLIRLHKDDPERALAWSEKTAQVILEQIEVLNRIASEFSHFAKLPKAKLQTFPVAEVVQEVVALFSKNKANAEIRLEASTDKAWIKADRDHLSRIFINLVRNALQSVPENGEGLIVIRIEKKEKEVTIEVQDNGPGIARDIQAEIFQPKFTTKSSGTGLGLAMCKNMIERMGGDIWFVSQPLPHTIFYVSLPIVQKQFAQNTAKILT